MKLLGASEMRSLHIKPDWLIGGRTPDEPGILPGKALTMLYGKEKSFKTFVILDMALSIAAGIDWHGYKTRQGPVVYVVAEDPHYLMERVDAWCAYHGLNAQDLPFKMVPSPVQLLNSDEIGKLCVLARDLQPVQVIFDTMGRCMDGGEETSNDDFHAVTRAMERIRGELDTGVLVVHHEGHGTSGKPRGASAMLGDMTTVIRVSREKTLTAPDATLHCLDQRVAPKFTDITVHMESHPTGRGGDLSLVVVAADPNPAKAAKPEATPAKATARTRTPQKTKRAEIDHLLRLNWTCATIAAKLGVPAATVRSRKRRMSGPRQAA